MTVQTHPHVTRDLRLAARQGLLPARGSGWLGGFSNMFAKELGEWFRTRRWWGRILIWPALINGVPGLLRALKQIPPEIPDILYYFQISVIAGTIGMIILAQDEIIQEKQSGTASWILSKPAARRAFVLSKLLSDIIGALAFIVVLPGLITLVQTYLATHQLVPLLPFLAGAGVVMLALIFYLSLVILLGVLFESRGPVLAIAFGVMIGGMFSAATLPQVGYILPIGMDKISLMVALGQPLPTADVSQVISTAVLSIMFTLVAIWRFQHKEF
jgi:ABC-2 type transport system permease protein